MNARESLLECILPLKIVDTHEHLPLERDLPRQNTDVLASWLIHYFSCDLVSAGLTPKELDEVRKPGGDLLARWKKAEPFWRAAENTGYGRALALAARDLFDIPRIGADTILELNSRFLAARARKDYYRWVLGQKSGIAVSIRDSFDPAVPDTLNAPDPFVFTLRTDPFIMPTHRTQMREIGQRVGVTVNALEDWEESVRRTIETYLAEPGRVVCLKCGLAYMRELRFEKATRAEAEQGFNQFFGDDHNPAWRPPLSTPKALQDYMQHVVCRIADEHGLVYQIHTGLQEGNGNILSHSNPTLLSNLFLAYENVKFDLFHISYPYTMEAGALAKNCRNVFLDMCWAHIISPEASRRTLTEWLDAVPANKIMGFGGDYCFPEGVYGHQYLARRNIASSLAVKVEDGSFDLDRAKEIARWLLVDNPATLFGLGAHV
jgi:predicted TIM-barrel fold metal-dependent hydrolase